MWLIRPLLRLKVGSWELHDDNVYVLIRMRRVYSTFSQAYEVHKTGN